MDRIDAAALERKGRTGLALLYGCTIFLSAFLLFQVQPVIGKMLLPWFGGSAAVWSACLLFFQALLLLGYLYAHWSSRFLAPRAQALLHVFLLACSIATLPFAPGESWKPDGAGDPALRILALMSAAIGLPYFLLSATGPLLQAWFAREKPDAVPYRLFALSNFGSMLGLLSYPAVFEPGLTITEMSLAWSAAYAAFAVLCAVLALRGLHVADVPARTETRIRGRPAPSRLLLWAVLAACPVVLLMGVTSHLTQNVAPVPFLWVLPLALYLLSFILCFEGGNWYRRAWYLPLFIVWFGLVNVDLITPVLGDGAWLPVAVYCGGLFVSCMLCHGELARMKPPPQHLTAFYLMLALGGAVGGGFVVIAAPRLFNGYYELPAAVIATALIILALVHRAPGQYGWRGRHSAMAVFVALISILAIVGTARQSILHRTLARNFYGTLAVDDVAVSGHNERQLAHGVILHGAQFLDDGRRHWPTTYYGAGSGASLAVLATRREGQPQRVGIIGLGAGTMAAYGRAGDHYRFYEINPLVAQLARSQFTFLSDSPASVETVMGDARLSLEREAPQRFDVLAVDAFSGDSVPVHLLTREAFGVYFRHLRPGGILAVHISNRSLDLAPVVKHATGYYGKQARRVDSKRDETLGLKGAIWILVSDAFDDSLLQGEARPTGRVPDIRPWTDDYSSIYPILK
ncbi:hypothetical protein EGT07_01495 [Herbaspirillum sp. HC18]|nr:hypothetical protein EGT07_01495 [Herbaspirillum sp. HC18]